MAKHIFYATMVITTTTVGLDEIIDEIIKLDLMLVFLSSNTNILMNNFIIRCDFISYCYSDYRDGREGIARKARKESIHIRRSYQILKHRYLLGIW